MRLVGLIRKKMKKLAFCVLVVAILSGCATRPASTDAIGIQAGREPSMASVDVAIRAQLASTLKDPDSIKQFQIIKGPDYFTWYRRLIYGGGHDAA